MVNYFQKEMAKREIRNEIMFKILLIVSGICLAIMLGCCIYMTTIVLRLPK
jgi:hypothetical protein